MKTSTMFLRVVLLCLLAAAFLAGCGSSDDGTGTTIPSFPYTGETARALINTTTAAALANGLYHSGQIGSILLEEVGNASYFPGYTVNGDCGGNSTNTLEINYTNLTINGTVTFENGYDTCEAILDGTVSASGKRTSGGATQSMTMTMDALSVSNSLADFAVAGRIAATIAADNTISVTQNLWFDDNGEVSKIVNFRMTIDDSASPTTITINSGNFYEPSVGYVTVSTAPGTPLLDYGPGPESGTIVISGADNSVAELRFIALDTAELWVDEGLGSGFVYVTTFSF